MKRFTGASPFQERVWRIHWQFSVFCFPPVFGKDNTIPASSSVLARAIIRLVNLRHFYRVAILFSSDLPNTEAVRTKKTPRASNIDIGRRTT